MPVPTHEPGCQTKMYATRCPDCGDSVFFFACSCGSRVFFDLNYPPWDPHEKRCWMYHVRIMREIHNYPEHFIADLIEREAAERNVQLPQEILDVIAGMRNYRSPKKLRIMEIPAGADSMTIVGKIKNVNRNINFFKKFDYPDNVMGRALLGKLVNDAYVEITLREENPNMQECSEFVCYMKMSMFLEMEIYHNALLGLTLQSFQLADGRFIWMLSEINII